MLTIQPQYLSLANLFEKRLFRIPDYQRAYSWTDRNRKDLFEDIRKIQTKDQAVGHFMAAIVCLRRGTESIGTDEFQILDVVDGQQRLTTLVLLFKSIELALDAKNRDQDKVKQQISDLLVKADKASLLLLQTNHDSSHHFTDFLRRGKIAEASTAKTLADRNLLNGIADCRQFVLEWQESGADMLALVSLLKNRLFFLLHEIDNEQAVYSVFEVLNSRGLEVSWLDRLKSILMGAAFDLGVGASSDLISELHTIWRDIYSCIGLRQGMSDESLRFAATLRAPSIASRPLSEADAVATLRDLGKTKKGILDTARWLLDVTQAYDKVFANNRLRAVTQISQARLLATAIFLRSDIKPAERERLIRLWESVTFRIYGMMRNDARTRVGGYVRLAYNVCNSEGMTYKEIRDGISEIGNEFPIGEAITFMRNTKNAYDGWEEELRYFFFRYEESLTKRLGRKFENEQWERIWMNSASRSIEHIWAQSKAPEGYVHRIGNLVLLPVKLNAQLSDKTALEKLESYRQTGLAIAFEVSELIRTKSTWNKTMVAARSETLLSWAAEEWGDPS